MTVYHGGKFKHGKQIAEIIKNIYDQQDKQTIRGYVEPFCGMCGVYRHIVQILPRHLKYLASDQHDSLILMWKALQDGWKPPNNCSISRYKKLKYSSPSPEKAYVGFTYSYGGQFFAGQHQQTRNKYVPDKSETISTLAREILNRVKFSKQSYEKYDDIYGYIIYCDPPYAKRSIYYHDVKDTRTQIKFIHERLDNRNRTR